MSITSYQAAYYIGLKTDWQTDRQRLHSLLFIAQMAYAFDNNGESLISNEEFYSEDSGPKLHNLDEHISCYGSKAYGNLFRRFKKKDENSPEINLLNEILHSFKDTPTHHLAKQTRGYAWRQHYRSGNIKLRISQNSVTAQSFLAFGKRQEIVLLSNAICEGTFTFEDIDLGVIINNEVRSYSLSEQEKQIIEIILEKYGSKEKKSYLSFGEDKFFFNGFAQASDKILLAISYMDIEHKMNYIATHT